MKKQASNKKRTLFTVICTFTVILSLLSYTLSSAYCCSENYPDIIKLSRATNVRELGGFTTTNGSTTKKRVFLRSDSLNALTNADVDILLKYGIKNVIDLRSEKDVASKPDSPNLIKEIQYKHIELPIKTSLLKAKNSSDIKMSDFYIEILKAKESIKEILNFLSSNNEGITLFHCTHGKDRTGILSLILLGLSGVTKNDLILDYSISYDLIKDKTIVKNGIINKGIDGYLSKPEYIKPVIEYINNTYGTFENYLLSCDISKQIIESVKAKLI